MISTLKIISRVLEAFVIFLFQQKITIGSVVKCLKKLIIYHY